MPPQKITSQNVEARAKLLLEQYQKKAMLYRTNNVLIPLGDDFRYENKIEWDYQYNNYKTLFDYINSRPDFNSDIKFATLNDYFTSVFDSIKNGVPGISDNIIAKDGVGVQIPSLSGDFFTYADREDHYWSGYYTSRPFYKRLDRVLQSYLRSAEILYTICNILGKKFEKNVIFDKIELARQNLALFQHHDAITGTAREAVVDDYANRMHRSLLASQGIISRLTESLIFDADSELDAKIEILELFPGKNSLPTQKVVKFVDGVDKWYVF